MIPACQAHDGASFGSGPPIEQPFHLQRNLHEMHLCARTVETRLVLCTKQSTPSIDAHCVSSASNSGPSEQGASLWQSVDAPALHKLADRPAVAGLLLPELVARPGQDLQRGPTLSAPPTKGFAHAPLTEVSNCPATTAPCGWPAQTGRPVGLTGCSSMPGLLTHIKTAHA